MQDKHNKQDNRYHKSGDDLGIVPAFCVGGGECIREEKDTRDA